MVHASGLASQPPNIVSVVIVLGLGNRTIQCFFFMSFGPLDCQVRDLQIFARIISLSLCYFGLSCIETACGWPSSYLVAEWKHSVEAGEYEGDECFHTLKKVTADTICCKKVPVREQPQNTSAV